MMIMGSIGFTLWTLALIILPVVAITALYSAIKDRDTPFIVANVALLAAWLMFLIGWIIFVLDPYTPF